MEEIMNPTRRKLKGATRVKIYKKQLATYAKNFAERDITPFNQAIFRLDSEIEELTTATDMEYPELTKERAKRLTDLYADAIRECDRIIQKNGGIANSVRYQGIKAMAQNIRQTLVSDQKALLTANVGLGATLPEVLKVSRSLTVSANNVKFDPKGGSCSQRLPMEIVLPSGKKVKGMFTKEKNFDPVSDFNAFCDKLAGYRDVQKYLPQIAALKLPANATADEVLDRFELLIAPADEFAATYKALCNEYGNLPRPEVFLSRIPAKKDLEQYKAYRKFNDLLVKFAGRARTPIGLNILHAGIKVGANIDDRNRVGSILANALGCADILANAVNMTLVQDGKKISGTFMEFAKGTDISSKSLMPEDKFYDCFSINESGIEQSYKLQTFDNIFGNIDRHKGNIFYQYSERKNRPGTYEISGVVGIDNDCSAGEKTFAVNKRNHEGVPADRLYYVPRSMAEKIRALTPESVRLMLADTKLSKKEKDQICSRLMTIKKKLTEVKVPENSTDEKKKDLFKREDGKIKIIDPGNWQYAQTTINLSMCNDENKLPENAGIADRALWLHTNADLKMKLMENSRALRIEKETKPAKALPEFKAVDVDKVESIDYPEMKRALETVLTDLNAVRKVWKGSEHFENMCRAAEQTQMLLENTLAITVKDDEGFRKIVLSSFAEMKQHADAYLLRKNTQQREGLDVLSNKKSVKRINAATSVLDYIQSQTDVIDIYKDSEYRACCDVMREKIRTQNMDRLTPETAGEYIKYYNYMYNEVLKTPQELHEIKNQMQQIFAKVYEKGFTQQKMKIKPEDLENAQLIVDKVEIKVQNQAQRGQNQPQNEHLLPD